MEAVRAIYRPRIVAACRSAGLDQWNADGLAEEILLKLLELLPAFQYDPEKGRFRGWLYGVVHNVVRKFKRRDGKGISPGERTTTRRCTNIPTQMPSRRV